MITLIKLFEKSSTSAAISGNGIENYSSNVATPEDFKVEHKTFDYENAEEILDVRHLKQFFRMGKGIYKYTKAVNDVSFTVYKGEVFGLVGESGCGKTTTGRSIIKLYQISSGDVWFKGVRIAAGTRWNEKEIKFTNIRLKGYLKDIINDRKNEFAAAKNNGASKEEIKAIIEKYEAKKADIIEFSKNICDEQLEKIKRAKFDDKYCDEHFSNSAIRRVLEENKEIIANYEKATGKKVKRPKPAYYEKVEETNHVSCCDSKLDAASKFRRIIQESLAEYHNVECVEKTPKPEATLTKEEAIKAFEPVKKKINEAKLDNITSKMQMIFQDPIASLNPRMNVGDIIAEGLVIKGIKDKEFIRSRVAEMLELVGLLPEHMTRYPHEFSGGQRQRIGIARALIMNPELIIADEPVSALDVSIQAQVINLLNDLREKFGLTILFIAHNLSVVKYFCDRIAVMYFGKIVELTTSEELFAHPLHPYTKSLLSAVPTPDPNIEKGRVRIKYNPNTAHDYSRQKPTLREIAPNHFVLCNDAEEAKYKEEIKK